MSCVKDLVYLPQYCLLKPAMPDRSTVGMHSRNSRLKPSIAFSMFHCQKPHLTQHRNRVIVKSFNSYMLFMLCCTVCNTLHSQTSSCVG